MWLLTQVHTGQGRTDLASTEFRVAGGFALVTAIVSSGAQSRSQKGENETDFDSLHSLVSTSTYRCYWQQLGVHIECHCLTCLVGLWYPRSMRHERRGFRVVVTWIREQMMLPLPEMWSFRKVRSTILYSNLAIFLALSFCHYVNMYGCHNRKVGKMRSTCVKSGKQFWIWI